MKLPFWIAGLCAVLAMCCAPAAAGIVNGGFENGLNGWIPNTLEDATSEITSGYAGHAGNVLHLKAQGTATFTVAWSEEDEMWVRFWDGGATAQAWAEQAFTITGGNTTLRFDALFTSGGLEVMSARVGCSPYIIGGGYFETPVPATESWNSYVMSLTDIHGQPLPDGTQVSFFAAVAATTPQSPGYEGQVVQQLAEGWFDNFQMVPEPASLALLALGALVMRGRRTA